MSGAVRAPALAEIVRAAGAIVRRGFDEPMDVAHKADGSPVTATDRAVDSFLKEHLMRLLPDAGWLSEETADDPARLTREQVWIVDPIDGTKEFVRRVPEIAVSVALVRGGAPVAAMVLNPIAAHEGVWVQGAPPLFSGLPARPDPPSLEAAEAIVSRTETEEGDLAGLGELTGSTRAVGSVAYKLLRVASRADALTYSVRPKSEWDVCAGIGLLAAAGRVFLRLDGAPNVFNRALPEIPCGAVAGPEPLASALGARLLHARRLAR